MKKITTLVFAALILFTLSISADTIVLKNGRTIDTSWVKVKNNKVTYKWTGGIMSISKSLVKKIIKNDKTEPAKRTTIGAVESSAPVEDNSAKFNSLKKDGETAAEEDNPKTTASYWSQELKRINEEIKTTQDELKDMLAYESALIRARRSTKEVRAKILALREKLKKHQDDLKDINEQARKNGITERAIELERDKESKEEKK